MKEIIVMPNSYKGSLDSVSAAKIIKRGLSDCKYPIRCLPLADGGDGTIDVVLSFRKGKKRFCTCLSPDGETRRAFYALIDQTALIEVAQSSGLTRQKRLNPTTSSTFGFGQLIKDALDKNIRDFVLCLGGSATTDGGMGMAKALGVKFFGINGEISPSGNALEEIVKIDLSNLDERIAQSKFTVMCDVDNTLYGQNGAAYVYAAQKGASQKEIEKLDNGLRNLSRLVKENLGLSFESVSGAGAAGGLGYGCMVFLGGKLTSGADTVLKLAQFDNYVNNAEAIITGEGKMDAQSLMGKGLSSIISHSKGKPIYSICGKNLLDNEVLNQHNIIAVELSAFADEKETLAHPKKYILAAAQEIQKRINK